MLLVVFIFILVSHCFSQTEPVLDGNLDDDFWQTAKQFNDFVQYSPNIGESPPEKTVVLVKASQKNLFIAFKVMSALKPIANVLERDQPFTDDDYVEVIIDSYNNNTDALSFQTNSLGTRVDYELSENVAVKNKSWNTIWDVRTQVTNHDWSAEFRIPFASLPFQASDQVIMGFKFIRQFAGHNSIAVYPLKNINTDNALTNLNYAEKINLGRIEGQSRLMISPYIVSNIVQQNQLNSDKSAYTSDTEFSQGKDYFTGESVDKILSNIGLDLKYKINSSNTIDISLNTDYAQAEADDRLINITRYSILQPEKRQFFLENANFFSATMADHIIFNSRNIGTENGKQIPIIGGLRFVGSSGDIQYGMLNMQSNGLSSENISAKNYTVARVTTKIKNDDSFIGAFFTHKNKTDTSFSNSVIGVDAIQRFGKSIKLNSFFSKSIDENLADDQNLAYGFDLNRYPQNGLEFSFRYRDYQANFNPELGFLSRPNTERIVLRAGYRFSFDDSFISRIIAGSYNTFYKESSSNSKQFDQHNSYTQVLFKSGALLVAYLPMYQKDYLYSNWKFSKNIVIPPGEYKMTSYFLDYRSKKSETYNYSSSISIGQFYAGQKVSLDGGISLFPSSRFNFTLSYNYNYIDLPDSYSSINDGTETVSRYSIKLKYNFSNSTSLNAFLQYDSNSKSMGSNLRFRYNISEGNDLFLIYNQLLNTTPADFYPRKPALQNQILLIKYKYLFVI